jgi:RNA polymerase sigma factor (sigma-70 family)
MSEPRGTDSVLMGDAAQLDMPTSARAVRSRRLLRLVGDERLVLQIQRGSEAAFEVAFERHSPAILGFCRHMLGSPEEAEDAVQHTFAAAYRDLQRGGEREIALKPWLFTIARNRCLSLLRARREVAVEPPEVATVGLAEQVEERAELRQLLADLRDLPEEPRAALLLAEVGGLAQADIASVLGCEVGRVKGLVYRARSALVVRREARDLPCDEIREQLANLRGGALRRTELRLHLNDCPGCRDFREQVRRQRQMLSVALPVVPTLGLKSSVLSAVGIGGAAAAGGAAAGGAAAGGAAVGGGAFAGIAKVAAVAVLAAGGTAVAVHERSPGPSVNGAGNGVDAAGARSEPGAASATSGEAGANSVAGGRQKRSAKQVGQLRGRAEPKQRPTHRGEAAPGRLKAERGRDNAAKPEHAGPKGNNGRGPIEAPPKDTPVRRGPPEAKLKDHKAKVVPAPRGQQGHAQAEKAEQPGPKLK